MIIKVAAEYDNLRISTPISRHSCNSNCRQHQRCRKQLKRCMLKEQGQAGAQPQGEATQARRQC
jgi:hypothetical protein